MSDLTDFLLARIAEDEEWAKLLQTLHQAMPAHEREAVETMEKVMRDEGEPRRSHNPARILAECEAKRRIAERCRPIDWTLLADAPELARAAWDVIDTLNKATLRDLAAPHADHPDYREEWKP